MNCFFFLFVKILEFVFFMSISYIIFLFLLYAIQGIPYGIQSRFIPIYLRSKHFSLTVLGFLKLLYIPWVLKTFYSPLIELKWTRIGWLKLSIFILFLISYFISCISENSTIYLILGLFGFNLFCAIQDIALDGIMLSQLHPNDISIGNIAQVVGYKSGAVIGGGLLLFLSYYLSWFCLFLFVSVIYLLAFVLLCLYSDRFVPSKSHRVEICLSDHWTALVENIFTRPTMIIVILTLIYKLSEQGAMNLLPLFLYDTGSDVKHIGFYTGIVGQLISVSGSSLAAFIIKKCGLFGTLYGLSLFSLPLHLFLMLLVFYSGETNNNFGVAVLLMNCLLFLSGVRTTAMFSLMMRCSQSVQPTTIQASHYTFLATTEVLGKLLFSSVTGIIADVAGYGTSYIIFLLLSIIVVLYLNGYRREIIAIEYKPCHYID